MRTRSQAKSVQPTNLVISPMSQPSDDFINFQQTSEGVSEHGEDGYSISRCKSSKCKACLRLSLYKYFHY